MKEKCWKRFEKKYAEKISVEDSWRWDWRSVREKYLIA